MLTHYMGAEEVDAYLRDLIERFLALGDLRPRVWCPIGPSGKTLAERILRLEEELADDTTIIPTRYDRANFKVEIDSSNQTDISGKNVLVFDSSVHSGSTMLRVIQDVQKLTPAAITSYTLVLKRSSDFVPTYWGVMIDDHDRAYFLGSSPK